jgi:CheY-like chemotaxis protein
MARIMFCEDDVKVRKMITVAMRGSTHEVIMGKDGSHCINLIRAEPPDLIFTDLSMPHVGGLDLCEAVRSDELLQDIPIIVMTASVQRSQTEASYQHGATDFLAKPFTMEQLRGKIAQYAG